jgi:hypothetical protein
MPDNPIPDLERLIAVFADMPCTNRETAAEKAAAHEWMEKECARRACRIAALRESRSKTDASRAKLTTGGPTQPPH